MSNNGQRIELASGKQLWRLNKEGPLHTALTRSGLHPITKAAAWELLADSQREQHSCPGDCHWPRSCALHGCWNLETAGKAPAYIGPAPTAVLDSGSPSSSSLSNDT